MNREFENETCNKKFFLSVNWGVIGRGPPSTSAHEVES